MFVPPKTSANKYWKNEMKKAFALKNNGAKIISATSYSALASPHSKQEQGGSVEPVEAKMYKSKSKKNSLYGYVRR